MIPKECKRLAEENFPIAEVSWHAAREESTRHGHPSMLHLWWARRPLASSRAVLLGLAPGGRTDASPTGSIKLWRRGTTGRSIHYVLRRRSRLKPDEADTAASDRETRHKPDKGDTKWPSKAP